MVMISGHVGRQSLRLAREPQQHLAEGMGCTGFSHLLFERLHPYFSSFSQVRIGWQNHHSVLNFSRVTHVGSLSRHDLPSKPPWLSEFPAATAISRFGPRIVTVFLPIHFFA